MKILASFFSLALVAVILAFGWNTPSVSADAGIHVQNAGAVTDSCAGCHRTHTAQAPNLLLDAQPALCYTCHGSTATGATTAVQSGSLYDDISRTTKIGALRGGGFDLARIDTADASLPPPGDDNTDLGHAGTQIGVLGTAAATQSWHTNDGTAGTMWGNGATNSGAGAAGAQINCGSCHDPHGSGNYRILRDTPIGSGAAVSVPVLDETGAKHYGTTDYLRPLAGLVPAGAGEPISEWCAQCHTRYLAANSDDSGDAIFAYRHLVEDAGVPICTNCHVAHGTNAAMTGTNSTAAAWPAGGVGTTENNNSRLLKMDNRGICQKCHNK